MAEVVKQKTMKRLKGFDYRKPYFYMVTLKRLPGLNAFSLVSEAEEPPQDASGHTLYLEANDLTRAFGKIIRDFHEQWWGLWPIECFIVMPDHIHLLIHIKDTGDQLHLGKYVYQLMKALSTSYWDVVGKADSTALDSTRIALVTSDQSCVMPAPSGKVQPIFAEDWHEWIVKKDGQLAAFTRYIRENPERAWLRCQNRQYFGKVRKVTFLGHEWFAYGNVAILDLPILKAVKGHRSTKPGSKEWQAMVEDCDRIGPGGAGVGTFMSPLEKECGNAIAAAGGKWVVLSPEGFHERWHPPRQYEKYCAAGRMLFLSLYTILNREPTKKELYERCHEMGDIAVASLPNAGCMI